MNLLQNVKLFSLISTAGISWILSTFQPDMMQVMNSYNPALITLYTVTWTAGMAAMMFPAIIPMVLLYNKLITNNESDSSLKMFELKFPYSFKVVLFVGMYLVVWAVTGIVLLFGWSVPMNIIANVSANNNIGIIFGSILIISGIYQFTPLKNKCIGYCESPLSFFMRRWQTGMGGNQDGNISWSLLPWMLLAIFSNHGCSWMDEPSVDGPVCSNYFWRKDMV